MNDYALQLSQTDPAHDFMTMYVEVTTWEEFEDLYEEDQGALGTFKVCVPRHLSPGIAAATALGAFHSTIPIKHLDCFEFEVYDEDGRAVEPDCDLDWYELAEEHRAFLD